MSLVADHTYIGVHGREDPEEEPNFQDALQNPKRPKLCNGRTKFGFFGMIFIEGTTVIAILALIGAMVAWVLAIKKKDAYNQERYREIGVTLELFLSCSMLFNYFHVTESVRGEDVPSARMIPMVDKVFVCFAAISLAISGVLSGFEPRIIQCAFLLVNGLFITIASTFEITNSRQFRKPKDIQYEYFIFACSCLAIAGCFIVELAFIPLVSILTLRDFCKDKAQQFGIVVFIVALSGRIAWLVILWKFFVRAFELPVAGGPMNELAHMNDSQLGSQTSLYSRNGRRLLRRSPDGASSPSCISECDIIAFVVTVVVAAVYFLFPQWWEYAFGLHIGLIALEAVFIAWSLGILWDLNSKKLFRTCSFGFNAFAFAGMIAYGATEWVNDGENVFHWRRTPVSVEWEIWSNVLNVSVYSILCGLDVTQPEARVEDVGLKFMKYLKVTYMYNYWMLLRDVIVMVFKSYKIYRDPSSIDNMLPYMMLLFMWPIEFHFEMMKLSLWTIEYVKKSKEDRDVTWVRNNQLSAEGRHMMWILYPSPAANPARDEPNWEPSEDPSHIRNLLAQMGGSGSRNSASVADSGVQMSPPDKNTMECLMEQC